MTLREFYLERQQAEFPIFMRILKALPKDRLSYKPNDRKFVAHTSTRLPQFLVSIYAYTLELPTMWPDVQTNQSAPLLRRWEPRGLA